MVMMMGGVLCVKEREGKRKRETERLKISKTLFTI